MGTDLTANANDAIFAVTMNVYKTTVRFNADELKKLRRAAGDANLTRYVKVAALRDADRKIADEEFKASGARGGGGGSSELSPSGEKK